MATEADITDFDRGAVAAIGVAGGPERRRQRWLLFWFYVGVPLALGFLLGWLQVGRAADWPRSVSLLYWVGVGLIMTPLNAVATALLAPLLRRLHCPLWLTLFCGQILGGFVLTNPALQAYRRLLQANFYPDLLLTPATSVAEFMQRLPSNSLLWIGINLLFFYGLRMPRFGYRPALPSVPRPLLAPAAQATTPVESSRQQRLALMERVRPERRGLLLALKADGHYLHVYTDNGSDLILYRLSDALLEVASEDGTQVHRSWWVAARALSAQRHRDRLTLANGVDVPVSRSFRVVARQRGWLGGADERDT